MAWRANRSMQYPQSVPTGMDIIAERNAVLARIVWGSANCYGMAAVDSDPAEPARPLRRAAGRDGEHLYP